MAEPINIGLDFGSLGFRAAYAIGEEVVSVTAVPGWDDPSRWLLIEQAPTSVPGLSFPALKSRLGMESLAAGGSDKRAAETVGRALAELRHAVEKQTGRPPGQLVIAVPALYSTARRSSLRDLALTAGFVDVHLLNDSMAAVIGYPHWSETPLTTLVYGLGYSGFEVGLIRVAKGGYWALAYDGGPSPSGAAFDFLVMRGCLQLLSRHSLWSPGHDLAADEWLKLRCFAESLKEMLSTIEEAQLSLGIAGADQKVLPLSLSRKEFEQAVTSMVTASLDAAERLLDDANLSGTDIDEVLLVGGGARVGVVERLVAERFVRLPVMRPDNLLARGAAVYAARLNSLPMTEAVLIRTKGSAASGEAIVTVPVLEIHLSPEHSEEPSVESLERVSRTKHNEPLLKPNVVLTLLPDVPSAVSHQPLAFQSGLQDATFDTDESESLAKAAFAGRERMFQYARRLIDQQSYDHGRGFLEGLIQDAQALLAAIPSGPAPAIKHAVEQSLQHCYELLRAGRFQQAVELAHHAYAAAPEDPQVFEQIIDIHCQAAMAHVSVAGYQKSLQWLMCAHSHDRTNPVIHDRIAERHFIHARQMAEQEDYVGALRALEESQYFNPEHEGAKALNIVLAQHHAR